ncbi:hypothetical protein vseg_007280 [Gypsophila vaccaria]
MAKKMIEKFDKYWEHINGLLVIATILDPRNKLDCVKYYFGRLYSVDGEIEVKSVRQLLDDLVVKYQQKNEGNNYDDLNGNEKIVCPPPSNEDYEDEYALIKKTQKKKVIVKGEVEHYLEDPFIKDDDSFDVLSWWKMNRRFPTLRKIVKDILAIPISSVASESIFSMGGRVVSAHRSRLHANNIEALMCLQNWRVQDHQGEVEETNSCSTINEVSDLEGDAINIIDLDVDDLTGIEDDEESTEKCFIH